MLRASSPFCFGKRTNKFEKCCFATLFKFIGSGLRANGYLCNQGYRIGVGIDEILERDFHYLRSRKNHLLCETHVIETARM